MKLHQLRNRLLVDPPVESLYGIECYRFENLNVQKANQLILFSAELLTEENFSFTDDLLIPEGLSKRYLLKVINKTIFSFYIQNTFTMGHA